MRDQKRSPASFVSERYLRTLRPKCGWITGYRDCDREGCSFPDDRCQVVQTAREIARAEEKA